MLSLIKDFVLNVWEERKVRLYGEHANVHQSHSQNDSGGLRGVAGGDGELGCLCGKAGTSHLCDGSAHSSGCVVNGYGCLLSYYYRGFLSSCVCLPTNSLAHFTLSGWTQHWETSLACSGVEGMSVSYSMERRLAPTHCPWSSWTMTPSPTLE